jgi:hypothetical protein
LAQCLFRLVLHSLQPGYDVGGLSGLDRHFKSAEYWVHKLGK